MQISIRGNCSGCEFHTIKITPNSGTYSEHYCSHSCITEVKADHHFPHVAISYDSADDKGMRLYIGEAPKTPRWCPFVDHSLWETIEKQAPHLTPSEIDPPRGGTDDIRWFCHTCQDTTVRYNGRVFICDGCP
jgi:hypothetical protein